METTLVPYAPPPRCSRAFITRTHGNISRHGCLAFSWAHQRRLFLAHSSKLPAAEHFREAKKILDNVAPKPLKEFPWEKAKDTVLDCLLSLGKNAFKWSFISWFIVTFVVDIFQAVSRNREVMIPLGLFLGVAVADFLKETAQEFFQSSTKDTNNIKNLLGIGSIFVLVKLISSGLNMQGQAFLSHIGNGGLMQVLWLARESQHTPENATIMREG